MRRAQTEQNQYCCYSHEPYLHRIVLCSVRGCRAEHQVLRGSRGCLPAQPHAVVAQLRDAQGAGGRQRHWGKRKGSFSVRGLSSNPEGSWVYSSYCKLVGIHPVSNAVGCSLCKEWGYFICSPVMAKEQDVFSMMCYCRDRVS